MLLVPVTISPEAQLQERVTLKAVGSWLECEDLCVPGEGTASLTLPAGLHAYPNALAFRFFLSVLVSYAVLFAMAAGTVRTTLVIVTALLAFMIVGGSLNGYLSRQFEVFQQVNVVEAFFRTLLSRNGPLEVFSGSWLLIDV